MTHNPWDMVKGNPAAQDVLKQLIADNPCHEDYCWLAELALLAVRSSP